MLALRHWLHFVSYDILYLWFFNKCPKKTKREGCSIKFLKIKDDTTQPLFNFLVGQQSVTRKIGTVKGGHCCQTQ